MIEDIEAFREQKQNAESEATKAIQRKGLTIEALMSIFPLKQSFPNFLCLLEISQNY